MYNINIMRRKSTLRSRFSLKNFTTKKDNLVYHQNDHYARKTYNPYSFRVGSHSRTRRNTTSKLRTLIYN